MSLLSLPDETLRRVIDNVQSHRDVAVLSQQCRRLHFLCDMSTRRKYRRLKLKSKNQLKTGFKMMISILQRPRLGAYVRHLELDRSTSSWSFSFRRRQALQPPVIALPPRDLEAVKEAIAQSGFRESREEGAMLETLLWDLDGVGHNDGKLGMYAQAVATLVAFFSPNLDSMAICPFGWEPSRHLRRQNLARGEITPVKNNFFRHFLERANYNPNLMAPYLQNLRTVQFLSDFTPSDDLSEYKRREVYASLNLVRRLPAIETINFNGITEDPNDGVHPPPGSANYRNVIIKSSMLPSTQYCRIVDSAKRLEKFVVTIGGLMSSDTGYLAIDLDDLFKSLHFHRNTLTHLDLNVENFADMERAFFPSKRRPGYRNNDGDYNREEYETEWAGELADLALHEKERQDPPPNVSLRNFANLKHLGLGIHVLYFFARASRNQQVDNDPSFSLADHLPPNLESLRIYGYKEKSWFIMAGLPEVHMEGHVTKLMEEKGQKLPLLIVAGVDECIPHDFMVGDIRAPEEPQTLQPSSEEEEGEEEEEEDNTEDEWTEHEF